MVILTQFPAPKDNPNILNYSPFCAKVEYFLKMNQIPYTIKKHKGSLKKTPNGKLPFVEYQGSMIPDSTLIIEILQKHFSVDMEKDLAYELRAQSYMTRKMIEEYFYWILLYFRWVDFESWAYTKEVFFQGLPNVLKIVIPNMIRKSQIKACYCQGIGRHDEQTIFNMGKESMKHLSFLLSDKQWFLGPNPTLLDLTAMSFLTNVYFDSNPNGKLVSLLAEFDNLKRYAERATKWHLN